MTTKPALPFAAGMLLGLAGGVFAGYKWAERKLGSEFEERLEQETEKYRVFYNSVPGNKYATPQEAVNELIKEDPDAGEALKEYAGRDGTIMYNKVVKSMAEEPKIDIPEAPPIRNIFQSKPDPNKPFVISQEEFMEAEPGYEQSTVTYYAKDDVLADERDQPIDEKDSTVGLNSLVSFGQGSSDENTVHVRNHYLKMDFEILLNESSFAREVLGLDTDAMDPPKKSARQRREAGE